MARLLILAAAAYLTWYAWQQYRKLPPGQRRGALLHWGWIAVAAVAVILAATGRLHWVGAAVAAAIPLAGKLIGLAARMLPMIGAWHRARASGTPSRIRTRGLEITIDFRSGQITGQVLDGPHTGRSLADMSEAELREQLAYFREHDRQSALLLNAYLQHAGRSSDEQENEQRGRGESSTGTSMSRAEALQILGLSDSASREDIVLAHKRLIQKLHPDRGGNDYLASKVNAARDKLLG